MNLKMNIKKAMPIKTWVLALGLSATSAIAITGCQTTAGVTHPIQAVTLPLTDAKLQNYYWQLVSVTDLAGKSIKPELLNQSKPLLVDFDKEGRVTFSNTCNRMWGNYILTNDNILVQNIASTRMMCYPESRMAFDAAAPSTLKGQFKLTQDTQGSPILTVTDNNQISIFKPVAK